MTIITILTLLQIKHLIFDWFWQTPQELNEKGTYGAVGGFYHSGKHALGTLVCLSIFISPVLAFALALLDGVVHYHIDWFKQHALDKTQWTAKDPGYWWAMGLDQYLHQICYLVIVSWSL